MQGKITTSKGSLLWLYCMFCCCGGLLLVTDLSVLRFLLGVFCLRAVICNLLILASLLHSVTRGFL